MLAVTFEEICGKVAHIIIENRIVYLQSPMAIEDIEDILIGKQQFIRLLPHIAEHIVRSHHGPRLFQIDQEDARIEIIVLFPKTRAVYIIYALKHAAVGGGGEDIFPQG